MKNEKKGFFTRLSEKNKNKKRSCCCNVELEELPEENNEDVIEKKSPANKGDSCCG